MLISILKLYTSLYRLGIKLEIRLSSSKVTAMRRQSELDVSRPMDLNAEYGDLVK